MYCGRLDNERKCDKTRDFEEGCERDVRELDARGGEASAPTTAKKG
jgi:hypothetical protein